MPEETAEAPPAPVVSTPSTPESPTTGFNLFDTARSEGGKSDQPRNKELQEQIESDPILAGKDEGGEGADSQVFKTESEGDDVVPSQEVKAAKEVADAAAKPDVVPTPQRNGQKIAAQRNYSIFDPADVPLAKKMGNDSFARFEKLYLENKELKARPLTENKTGLPDSYYSHPEAYKLSKEYNDVAEVAKVADKIHEHWVEQEFTMKSEGKVRDLGRDPKTGELIVGPQRDATVDDAKLVGKMLLSTRRQADQFGEKLDKFKDTFDSKYNQEVASIKTAENEYFPGFDDEKHPTKLLQKAMLDKLPESMRSSPLASFISKIASYAALERDAHNKTKLELAKLKGIKQDSAASGPKKSSFVSAGKGSNDGNGVGFEIFKRAREEDNR